MMRVCHLNTCPAGVATQDPRLREKFTGKPEHAVNFMRFIAQDLREIMAQLGFRTLEDMVGRVDMLEPQRRHRPLEGQGLRLQQHPLRAGRRPRDRPLQSRSAQDHGLDKSLDVTTLARASASRRSSAARKSSAELPIRNVNRVVGTITGSEVTKKYGAEGLPEDTIQIKFKGSAGQSFGAFMPKGMTLRARRRRQRLLRQGPVGRQARRVPVGRRPRSPSEENIIVGNVALYGATSGEVFVRGMAGERFAVRNSGVDTVVEAVGDHGCEYMTGGRVVVLGPTGRNFAAGMSGGIAYVLDENNEFAARVNTQMVDVERVEDPEEAEAAARADRETRRSTPAASTRKSILAAWDTKLPKFVRVIPKDYKRVLACLKRAHDQGLSGDEAIMAAFEENARDLVARRRQLEGK